MRNETLIDTTISYIKALFAGSSDGHDADHSLRVYKNALAIASNYLEADMDLISLSSLLHDVDDHKLFQTENNSNARTFLKNQNVPEETIEEIVKIINSVSFSKNKGKTPETLEAKIVQDADRLDAMGAIGIARTFAYGGKKGRSLDDSVQHFHDKLLLLRDTLNTDEARALAKQRHEFMVKFLEELSEESLGSID
ncbi:MAG: HD domain-containing protein [Clostridiales bacterium]|nr:HD domain-containing protein [Clostridiales bacterium]